MNKSIYFGAVAVILVFALAYASVANAQNVTTNASNAAGNASASANQTALEVRKNASELGKNVGGNASELGKNVTEAGKNILNKTGEVGQGLAGGLGSLLGNASEKLKESAK